MGARYLDVQFSIRVFWLNLPDKCCGDQCRSVYLYSSWHLQILLSHRHHMVPLWWSGLWVLFSITKFSENLIVKVRLVELFTILWKLSGQVPFPSFHCKRKKLSELKSSHWLLFGGNFSFMLSQSYNSIS